MEFSKKIEIFKIVQRLLMVILTVALLYIFNQARLEMSEMKKELHLVVVTMESCRATAVQYTTEALKEANRFNDTFDKLYQKIKKAWWL